MFKAARNNPLALALPAHLATPLHEARGMEDVIDLRNNQTQISVYLVNGVRLHGFVAFFDNYIVAVRSDVTQLIYKHAISTIMPSGAELPHLRQRKAHDANVSPRTKRSRFGPVIER